MRVRLLCVLAVISGGLVQASACGPKENDLEIEDGGVDADAGVPFDATFDTSECTEQYCSSDLRNFVDCSGNVLTTCPPNQGCTPEGACIPACDAVKRAKGSIGCEFFVHHPEVQGEDTAGCFAMYVVNTWSTPVTITGEAGGVGVDLTSFAYLPSGTGTALTYKPLEGGEIPPGGVAIIFLHEGPNANPRCPKTPASASAHPNWRDVPRLTAKYKYALKVTSSAPIAAYDIYPFGGGRGETTSATLLLPTSTWDKNYVAVTPYPKLANVTPPAFSIIAAEDGTKVTLLPTEAVVGGNGVDAAGANTPKEYTLDQGEVLHISQDKDLIGSVVASDKPVGFWAEQACVQIGGPACDGMHQQIPPVQALGHEYVGVRYRNRVDGKEESPPWRLVGVVNDTKLEWEPSVPPEAPTVLKAGRSYRFNASGPFIVRSQDENHPFYMNAYMTGSGGSPSAGTCDVVNDPLCFEYRGDPEFVNVIPTEQFQTRYGFFTDPTYPETNLVFVRAKAKDGTFKDVTLQCLGKLTGWQPIGTSGKYEYTRTDLSRFNFEPQGTCDNGRHEAKSDGPFSLTIWGWGSAASGANISDPGYSQYVSYAYPAGASLQLVNTVVVPPVPR